MIMKKLAQLAINYSVHFNIKRCYWPNQRYNLLLYSFHQKLHCINSYREFSFRPNREKETISITKEIIKPSSMSNVISVKEDNFNMESLLLEETNEQSLLAPRKINVLAPSDEMEDVEFIAPELKPTFNLAAYADKSETLKHFINLGVEIAKWEKNRHVCIQILKMDWEKEIKPFIFFLNDIGIPTEDMGYWLTKNPEIFQEIMENLYARINYLSSKNFTKENISSIVNRTPSWINFNTIIIDKELGIYQRRFRLTGNEVRQLAVADPKLVLYTIKNKFHLERMSLAIKDELGFTKSEMKILLLKAPRIYRTNGSSLFRRFDVIHHEMGLTHDTILQFPQILLCRDQKLSERHQFLKYMNKNQYNPEKPNYVSPKAFVMGSDGEFCVNVAGVSTDLYNDFLKTL